MEPNGADNEKRQFQRVPKEVGLRVRRLQYPLTDVKVDPAVTRNMADQGICFRTVTFYEVGTLLNLEIDLRGWQHYLQNVFSIVDTDTITKPLTAIAEVTWTKKLADGAGYDTGVRFRDVYEDDLLAFQTYLKKILERENLP
jgi:hypothetical protein